MPWDNAQETVIAQGGEIYTAPVGTVLPTAVRSALASAFVGLGFVSEDGVGFNVDPDVFEASAWQSRQAIRRELNKQEVRAVFELQQWNEETVKLAFGGGTVSAVGGGGYKYTPPADRDALVEYAMVIDWEDGSENHRLVLPRGNPTENVETQLRRTNLAQLPITFKALEPTTGGVPFEYYTDSAAFAAGS